MIHSTQNKKVITWKKLRQKKYRDKYQQFLIEGLHLIEEARQSRHNIETLIFREDITIPNWAYDYNYVVTSKQVFSEVVNTTSPQGIAAVVLMAEKKGRYNGNVLLIDAVQDPGNLGTLIRTALAFGFSQIVLGDGTVDAYNDKVVRATQGALFHANLRTHHLIDTIAELKDSQYMVLASGLSYKAKDIRTITVEDKLALIVGNEGAGVSTELLNVVDKHVKIPIASTVESLNVAVAGGIMMYHFSK